MGWVDPGGCVSAGRYRTWRLFSSLPTGLVPFGGQPDHGAEQDANYKICRKGDHNVTSLVSERVRRTEWFSGRFFRDLRRVRQISVSFFRPEGKSLSLLAIHPLFEATIILLFEVI
jgi:hypothetical protein